ncbi:glycosyltransferase family 39 protein [Pseudomonas sp. SWRI154]|uniref:glycosyltransferase family 39 protein n=1 Tax=Pseudomonas sp. SWRI154 TaxID=2745501 RepID=UPI001647544B|nr:glycosyltransferase family 39 protein [Pseudomonas sp. SWRI154]MBC3364001.1 glycosyltransferase family 39 protein [Pseudomonas sp. SWRI154]
MTVAHAYSGKFPSWYIDGLALAAVVLLAVCVRFYGITTPPIWFDEAFSVLLARHEPLQIWSITGRDIHPPLYYFFLHYWMLVFGDGVLAVRSLSAVADVGTVLLGIKLMSLVATRRATWIAAVLLALLPISVRYSQEARMYTLLGFWLMGATVVLVCWVKEPENKIFPAFYILLMTAAFYTHYFAALGVLVHWFYWWAGRPGIFHAALPGWVWVLVNGTILGLLVPWALYSSRYLLGNPGIEWIPAITWTGVFSLFWQFIMLNGKWAHSAYLYPLPLMLVVSAILISFWDRAAYRFNTLLGAFFLVPIVVVALVSLFVPVFVPRYLLLSAIGLSLVVAVGLDFLGRRHSVVIMVLMFIVLVEVLGLLAVYKQTDNFDGVGFRRTTEIDVLADKVKQNIEPVDHIVVDTFISYLVFAFYNKTGVQPRLYLKDFPDEADRNHYALISESFKDPYLTNIETLRCHEGRVWWIADKAGVWPSAKGDWKKIFTLVSGEMAVSLFVIKATPSLNEVGNQTNHTQPPLHAAESCPLGPHPG